MLANNHILGVRLICIGAVDVMRYYQKAGLLRKDIKVASLQGDLSIIKGIPGYILSISDADYVVIEFLQSGFSDEINHWINSHPTVFEIQPDTVPLIGIYVK